MGWVEVALSIVKRVGISFFEFGMKFDFFICFNLCRGCMMNVALKAVFLESWFAGIEEPARTLDDDCFTLFRCSTVPIFGASN
jgi:hypothetical protein